MARGRCGTRATGLKTPRRFAYPVACAVALLVTVATYSNHFHNDIPLFFTSTSTFSSLPANQSYRPLVTATLAMDYWLGGGLNPAAAVAVLLVMAYGTWQRNIVWRTEESLWLDATNKSPENGRDLMNYGVIQTSKGNFPVADEYFERALRYSPQYAYLHVNIGVLKGALGQPAEAERHFREAQRYDPNNPVSYTFYARWLKSVGRTQEALLFARRAVELSPADGRPQTAGRSGIIRPALNLLGASCTFRARPFQG